MRRTLPLLSSLLLSPLLPAQAAETWFEAQLPMLQQLYRQLHRHPELSFQEIATRARIADEFEAAGAEVTRDVGGGVVGVLRNGDGPVLLLRTDMDALPVDETTGLDYASAVGGVMHACGHDLHMTNLVGVARWCHDHQEAWRGTLLLIAQPAEEVAGGAKAMLAAGLYQRFGKPTFALALHVAADLPTGSVGVRSGYAMANVDSCDITLFGKGGHGSAPQLCIDPIVQAAQLVLDLQTIVSREVDPVEPAVVTVGSIHGGHKHNIIGDRCQLQLTLRSYAPAVRELLRRAVVRKAEAVAQGAGAPKPEVVFSEPAAALRNDPALTERVSTALQRRLGPEHVVEVPAAMTAEDFAAFGAADVPLCMFRLGSIEPARLQRYQQGSGPPSLHSPGYFPDAPAALRTGIAAMAAVVCELLPPR